eukprot:TRINITY_DN6807_c0_g1_i1.p1 TRINITY_DN6807_c0_g1~~TRINITY_DN6807_c0_g1_i1.p1  ORF type:complete len:412 (-),score=79.78 TRINITY_DN6807_c0_g1_i1:98-1333(-)
MKLLGVWQTKLKLAPCFKLCLLAFLLFSSASVEALSVNTQMSMSTESLNGGSSSAQVLLKTRRSIEETSQAIEELERSVMNIAKDGQDPSKDSSVFVRYLTDMVNNQMLPEITNQRSSAIQVLDSLYGDFDKCQEKVPRDRVKKPYNWDFYSGKHKTCRLDEGRAFHKVAEATSTWEKTHAFMTAACTNFENLKTIPDENECGNIQPDTDARNYALKLAQMFKEKYDGWLEAKALCENQTKTEEVHRRLKEKSEEEYAKQKAICDLTQDMMDQTACAFKDASDGGCECYNDCYAKAYVLYNEQMNRTKELEVQLADQWRTLKRIQCILTAVVDKSTPMNIGVENCKQVVHLDESPFTTSWSLVRPAPNHHCTPPIPYVPTLKQYIAAEYQKLPADAPAKACVARPCCEVEP